MGNYNNVGKKKFSYAKEITFTLLLAIAAIAITMLCPVSTEASAAPTATVQEIGSNR